jgi:hypothetical protein
VSAIPGADQRNTVAVRRSDPPNRALEYQGADATPTMAAYGAGYFFASPAMSVDPGV